MGYITSNDRMICIYELGRNGDHGSRPSVTRMWQLLKVQSTNDKRTESSVPDVATLELLGHLNRYV
jgi:hypothetical protein